MTNGAEKSAAAGADASAASRARAEFARLISYIVFGLGSVYLSVRASALPTSRWEPLGAGSFPKLVFAVLAVLCLISAVRTVIDLRKTGHLSGLGAALAEWLKVRRFALLVIYLGVLPYAGFSLATFAFLLITQLMIAGISKKTVIQSLIAALIFSVGLNLLFAEVFNVFLPRGVLFAG